MSSEREDVLTQRQRRERIARPQAQRILAAARRLLGERGAAGATFEAITSEAQVGRGSIVYFFGSKQGMLVELLHVEAEERLRRLERRLAPAATLDELLDAMGAELAHHLDRRHGSDLVLLEIASLALTNAELQRAQAALRARWRAALAAILADKQRQRVVRLALPAERAAALLTALAHGIAAEARADPGWGSAAAVADSRRLARWLLEAG